MKSLDHRETQLELLEIMKEIDAFCKERGIKYSLAYGTLLGAVRHKGFIPWDDDVDLQMLRPDFERFVAEFRHPRYICHYKSPKFTQFFAKIEDPSTICAEKKISRRARMGLNVDIFPIDGKPEDMELQLAHEKKIRSCVRRMFILRRGFFTFRDFNLAKLEAFARGRMYWINKAESLMKSYDVAESAVCGCVSVTFKGVKNFPRSVFENYTEVEFEGVKFPAFADWDTILKAHYGDYMQLPPEDRRKIHHTAVYRK